MKRGIGMDEVRRARLSIAEVASSMLSGTISFIEGARRIQGMRWDADLEWDGDILVFVGITSETDSLPQGDVKRFWRADALEKLQPEINRMEKWADELGRPACQKLIDRFSN